MIDAALTEQIIDAAKQIHGWMSREELAYLIHLATKAERILEIGSYQGRSAFAMASAPGDRTIVCVDDWRGEPWEDYAVSGQSLHTAFLQNVAPFIAEGRIVPFHGTSAEYLQHWYETGAEPFDLVFIDGDHNYASVILDVAIAWAVIQEDGGVIAGHDYVVYDNNPEIQVVPALARCMPLITEAAAGTIWSVQIAKGVF